MHIAIAYGDGIGAEVMEASLLVLRESGADITIHALELGERIYNQGSETGILPSGIELLKQVGVLLKAPAIIPKPQGSQTVIDTLKTQFELHGVCWPAVSYAPLIEKNTPEQIAMKAACAYVGEGLACFTPVHGVVRRLEGKNKANPSAMLHAVVLMLNHIGQPKKAELIYNAWLKTLQDGLHTRDMRGKNTQQVVGTREFAESVVQRLGVPCVHEAVLYSLISPSP